MLMNQQFVTPHDAPLHGSHNLPVQAPDELFGRDADLSSVHLSLKAGTAVLLYGPPGVGKTALAAALAAGYAELPGGVLWLEVADDSLRALIVRVARAYGTDIDTVGDDLNDRVAYVRGLLQQNRPLVVLDGRHLEGTTREFVRRCASGVPLLLTHDRLMPGPWTPYAVEPLEPEDSRAMLIHLARNSFEAEMAEVDRLTRALGGYALAIYVAGRQLATGNVTPEDLLARLPDVPEGETNRTMAVLMAAYRLLPGQLQGLILLLGAAFAGGGSDELLSDVGGAPVKVIQAAMHRLFKHGFVSERTVYDQPYFTVHERVQTFAQTFLRGKKQLEAMQARHLRGLATYVQRHTADNNPAHHERLIAEMPNVLGAGRYAVQQGHEDQLQTLVDLLAPDMAEDFADMHHYKPEVIWLEYLLDHPEAAEVGVLARPDLDVPVEPLETVTEPEPEPEPSLPPAAEAVPLGERSAPEEAAPDVQEQDTVAAPAVYTLREPDEDTTPPAAEPMPITDMEKLHRVTAEAVESGAEAESIEHYGQALEAYQADGNVDDEIAALEALAALNLEQENYSEVLDYVEQGISLAEQADNPQREGQVLALLGELQAMLGRYEGAETAYREAVDALRPIEAWLDIGLTLNKLGDLYLDQGQPEDALDVLQQSIPIFEREERPDYLRDTLDMLGEAHTILLHWDQARTNYSKALELAQSAGDEQAVFDELWKLADLHEASGDRDAARSYYRRALKFAFALDDAEQVGYTLLALARLLMDDTVQLNRVVQLLEAASERLPDDPDVGRLLKRAQTRQMRLATADVDLLDPEEDLHHYAAG